MITLVVMGVAFSTFKDALATQRRGGPDLGGLEPEPARRHQPAGPRPAAGGAQHPDGRHPIPSGSEREPIHRPGPPGSSLYASTTTRGRDDAHGDHDRRRPRARRSAGQDDRHRHHPDGRPVPRRAEDVSVRTPPTTRRAADRRRLVVRRRLRTWLARRQCGRGRSRPIAKGDLIYFSGVSNGSDAADGDERRADDGLLRADNDPFNFNQPTRTVRARSRRSCRPDADVHRRGHACGAIMTMRRVFMYTYYVHEDTAGMPRLMRAHQPRRRRRRWPASSRTSTLSYDLVDGDDQSDQHQGPAVHASTATYLQRQPDPQGQRARRRAIRSEVDAGPRTTCATTCRRWSASGTWRSSTVTTRMRGRHGYAGTTMPRAARGSAIERSVALVTTMLVMMLMSALMVGFTAVVMSDQRYRFDRPRSRPGVLRGAVRAREADRRSRRTCSSRTSRRPTRRSRRSATKTPSRTSRTSTFTPTDGGAEAYGVIRCPPSRRRAGRDRSRPDRTRA